MTDKEWYAKLSTLVLEGIDKINKGESSWRNQNAIREFIRYENTPGKNKAKIIKIVSENVSTAMKYIGYIAGLIVLAIDAICWMICAADELGYGVPTVMFLAACLLGAIGLAGQIWHDLID